MARRAKNPRPNGRDAGTGPHRCCLVSRASLPVVGLLRFVVGPDNVLAPDLENRLPGRGLWLSATRSVVNTACSKGLFAKAARRQVATPEDLADRVEALLVRRCLNLIGLARRGGLLTVGQAKVAARLRMAPPGLLIEAADGAAAACAKMRALAPDAPVLDLLGGAELGPALGRERVVHATVGPGSLADLLTTENRRLAGFRPNQMDRPEPSSRCEGE